MSPTMMIETLLAQHAGTAYGRKAMSMRVTPGAFWAAMPPAHARAYVHHGQCRDKPTMNKSSKGVIF